MNAILSLPSYLRERLVRALQTGLLGSPYSIASLRSVLGSLDIQEEVVADLLELEKSGVSSPGIAVCIRAVEKSVVRIRKPDLVWSGPAVAGLHARDTRRVYEELLGSAEHSIWASTYAFFDGPKAFEILASRMDERPEIKVTLLLNIQRKKGDTRSSEFIIREFADRFWKHEWPGNRRPKIYYDPRSLDLNILGGVLHAKALIADNEFVFVTSANLTEAALDRNIELGLLLTDKALAMSTIAHFSGLIDSKILSLLPNN